MKTLYLIQAKINTRALDASLSSGMSETVTQLVWAEHAKQAMDLFQQKIYQDEVELNVEKHIVGQAMCSPALGDSE